MAAGARAELRAYLAAMEQRILVALPPMLDAVPKAEEPAFLKAAEAAAYIRVHVETFRDWSDSAYSRTFRYPEPERITALAGSLLMSGRGSVRLGSRNKNL
jgi:hypothetical protein